MLFGFHSLQHGRSKKRSLLWCVMHQSPNDLFRSDQPFDQGPNPIQFSSSDVFIPVVCRLQSMVMVKSWTPSPCKRKHLFPPYLSALWLHWCWKIWIGLGPKFSCVLKLRQRGRNLYLPVFDLVMMKTAVGCCRAQSYSTFQCQCGCNAANVPWPWTDLCDPPPFLQDAATHLIGTAAKLGRIGPYTLCLLHFVYYTLCYLFRILPQFSVGS